MTATRTSCAYPRYDETFDHEPRPTRPCDACACSPSAGIKRTAPRRRAQRPIGHWKELNEIRAFVAHEQGAIVALARHAWDPERLAEGQLVLLHAGCRPRPPPPLATSSTACPNLDVPLRVEDVGESELIISCGDQDLVRVERVPEGPERTGRCG